MLVALGMTLVIATRGVDLSVGAVVAIAGMVASLMVSKGNLSLAIVVAAALGVSLMLGLWNGLLVSVAKIQPIVATLILMVSGRGVAQLLGGGQIITFTHPGLSYFGGGYLLGLPFSIALVLGTLALIGLLTRQTAMGLFIESVGDNPVASRYSGIDVRVVLLFVYAVTGVCAGIAGLIVAAETRAADANNAGLYIELDAILAVVLGGTSLNGGRFQLVGSLIGALLIQTLTTTILTKGVQYEWTLVIKAVLVLAVSLMQSGAFRRWATRGRFA